MGRNKLTMLLAANIQTAMGERETNAAQLAKDAKVNPTGVYDIISGKSRSPKLDTIDKIAKALGVSVSYLLRDRSGDDLRSDIINILDALPLKERKRLLVTARAWILNI